MVAGHGLYTECQPDRPQGSHDFNWIIHAGINLLYMRSKANQIFNCLIDQTDNVGIWLGIAERPAVSDAQFSVQTIATHLCLSGLQSTQRRPS